MRSSWWRWLTRFGVVASFALMGWFLWQHVEDLRAVNWHTMALPMVVSLGLYGLALALQGATWIGLFAQLTATPWTWNDVRTYVTTHLMRRLPGAPWYMAGRAVAYRERSAEAAWAAVAVSLMEWGGLILSGLLWVAWGRWGWGGALGAMAALLLLLVGLRRWRWPTRWVPLERFSLSALITALTGYSVQWYLAAWMLFLVVRGMAPAQPLSLWQMGGLWAISGVLSSLAVFAPAGLGIREVSLVALLEPYVGLGYAVLAALLMRVLFVLGDLVWGSLALLTGRLGNTP